MRQTMSGSGQAVAESEAYLRGIEMRVRRVRGRHLLGSEAYLRGIEINTLFFDRDQYPYV